MHVNLFPFDYSSAHKSLSSKELVYVFEVPWPIIIDLHDSHALILSQHVKKRW